jgi:hypothetical protein
VVLFIDCQIFEPVMVSSITLDGWSRSSWMMKFVMFQFLLHFPL